MLEFSIVRYCLLGEQHRVSEEGFELKFNFLNLYCLLLSLFRMTRKDWKEEIPLIKNEGNADLMVS